MCILLAVFVVSTLQALRQWLDNTEGETAYGTAVEIAMNTPKETLPEQIPPEVTEPAEPAEAAAEPVTYWVQAPVEGDAVVKEMAGINLAALQEENEDVIGWIRIPGTKVDYPIMQAEDNDFYLNHTWDKQPNSVGSIFLEHLNSPNMTDYNTIIYGHNMRNNSMFGELDNYALEEFWQEHPYVYVATADGIFRYEVFAFCQAKVDSLTYGVNLTRDDTKQEFLNLSLETARYDTGIVPELTDRILTLSTCSGADYSNRYVVQARLPLVEVTK